MNNEEMTNNEFWEKNIQSTYGDLLPTLRDYALTRNNKIKHTGFDYRGQVLKKSLSAVLFSEVKRQALLERIDSLLDYLIDSVKNIKKHTNFALPKRWRDFN